MCGEYGQPLCPYINVDAPAAIGIAQRKGLGNDDHAANANYKWICVSNFKLEFMLYIQLSNKICLPNL